MHFEHHTSKKKLRKVVQKLFVKFFSKTMKFSKRPNSSDDVFGDASLSVSLVPVMGLKGIWLEVHR